MGACPFPYMLAFLAPFVAMVFRVARRRPPEALIKPITRRPGQYLPRQTVSAAEP